MNNHFTTVLENVHVPILKCSTDKLGIDNS